MVARVGGIASPYVVLLVNFFFQYSLFYSILLCLILIAIALIFSYFKPFQADLPNLWKKFPLLIFGVVGLAAGILAFWLPETLTADMPQTVEKAEAWDDDYNLYCCKEPQIQGPRGRKEVAKEGEDATLV